MTATEQKWTERIEGWRESGLTSEQFSEGREFSADGLRHWAYKLGKTKRRRPRGEVPELRIVRVVRAKEEAAARAARPKVRMVAAAVTAPAAAATARATVPAPVANAPSHVDASLGIEVGGVRIVVPPTFDRATLAAVLELLAERGGGR